MADAPAALAATLRGLGAAMAGVPDGWWVIGSAAVALHGGAVGAVHDVDLLVDEGIVAAVMARLGVGPVALPPDPRFRSRVFARCMRWPLTVEVMAGFAVASGGGWQPVAPRWRVRITVGGEALWVPGRAELLAMLQTFDRPKDRQRAAALGQTGREPG